MVRPVTERPKAIVIAGPTGSGKSQLAMEVANLSGGEIVGCDSVQLYRGFDIGSAKPTREEMDDVSHHMVDIVDPAEEFDAALYADHAVKICTDIRSRGGVPLIVGGSGLYLRSLVGKQWHGDLPTDAMVRARLSERETEDLYAELLRTDRQRAEEIHPNDRLRIVRALELWELLGKPLRDIPTEPPPIDAAVVLLMPERDVLHERIARRAEWMLANGLIEEVRELLDRGVPRTAKPMQSIGYKEVADMIYGDLPEADLLEAIKASTRQYAKRQCTWFRKVDTHLVLAEPSVEAVLMLISDFIGI